MNTHTALHTGLKAALCSEQSLQFETALCFELPTDGDIPEWVPLIPVGLVEGRDERKWQNNQPDQVILNTKASNREQPLDYEHATELKAPKGEEAPAAGWFSAYRVNAGHIEGRLQLTPRGLQSVQNREYRYLSPVFRYDAQGNVYDIRSAGLTNTPNLLLPALNQEHPHHLNTNPNHNQENSAMDLAQLLAALATALNCEINTPEDVLEAIKKQSADLQTAQNREVQPDLTKFVPMDTHNAALQRATNAEQQLADNLKTARNAEIDAALIAAIEAGKIAPASEEFYRTACNAEGGLDQFRAFIESAPSIAQGSGLGGKKPNEPATALNAEQKKIDDAFGNSAEDIAKFGN